MEQRPNLSAEIVLPWGDGEYTFALKGKQIEHLEKACDSAIADIARRVVSMRPYYKDITQIILLGLEGGGMPPTEAKQNIDRYLDGRPLAQLGDPASPLATAIKVISAAWFGLEDLPKKGEEEARAKRAEESTSQVSEPLLFETEQIPVVLRQ